MTNINHRSGDLVSVVLPVYNGAQYLRESVDSILRQTYQNFELIIINDGSKDASQAIINSYSDPRIRSFEQANMGLAATLNKGIGLAKGRWIARQDQDDVSFPDRLAKQVQFMDAHPDFAMVGTAAQIWVGDEVSNRFHRHPYSDEQLRAGLLFYNYFVHSAVMLDKAVLEAIGSYSTDPARQPPEDYELWSRIAREYRVANLPDVLLAYREVGGSMSRDAENPFTKKLILLTAENIAWALDVEENSHEVQALAHLMHRVYPKDLLSGFGWTRAKRLFDQVMVGIAAKAALNRQLMHEQERRLLQQLRLNYLDSLTGGRLSKLLSGKTREQIKKLLRIAA